MKNKAKTPVKQKELPYDIQAIFCRQMAFVVKSGIPLANSYQFLKTEDNDSGGNLLIDQVFSQIKGGSSFTDSMKQTGCFSEYLISVIRLGEKTGNLERALTELADYFEQLNSIKRKIREAFLYPVILLVLMLAVILFLIIEVMPKFAEIIAGAGGKLPALASAILNIGFFLRNNYITILAVLAVIIAGIIIFVHSLPGRRWLDRLSMSGSSIGGTTRKLATARFCSAMRMALSCGNSFTASVELTAGVANNSEVTNRLLKLKSLIESGTEIPDAIGKIGLFPASFANLFSTAYKTGNLEETLDRMSSYYEESYDDSIYSLTSKIEPALVIILSVIAGIILFSVMIPIINVMQMIG